MGIGEKISLEVQDWGVLAILIVIISIVLLQFKGNNPGNITCASGYNYSSARDLCLLETNQSVNQSVEPVALTIDRFVAGISEPENWVAIVIIAIIGISLFLFFRKKRKNA